MVNNIISEVFLVVLDTAESEVKSALEETDLSIVINYRQISSNDDWGTADSLRYMSRDITVRLTTILIICTPHVKMKFLASYI